MKFLLLTFCLGSFGTLLGCHSRKDEHIRILYEAREFEKSLSDLSTKPDHEFLEELINKIDAGNEKRWRISNDPRYLIQTNKKYMDYRNRGDDLKFYIITVNGVFILE